VMFTSSSALDLYRGESDLSRRLITQTLHGLSFREYLAFKHDLNFPSISFREILHNQRKWIPGLTSRFKPLPLFKKYLKEGYFPFARDVDENTVIPRLLQIINTVLESDLSFIENYTASNITKIKKLLGVIAASAPVEPNISKIAERLQLGRNTVNMYLKHLSDGCILNLLHKLGRGMSLLQKPDKIYFENASFAYAMQSNPNMGTIRETFFINQLKNAGHEVNLSDVGDFWVDGQWVFEVGGKNKTQSKMKGVENSYLALDDIETGFGNKIPLWLFGFLY